MDFKLVVTIFISKLIIKICRLFKTGGTTLPGKIAHRIYPEAIKIIASRFRIIMVTGTNGKTTTSRIIGQILKENNIEYISNKSGANLSSGIITTFIQAVNFTGKSNVSTALIEVDEAAFLVISKYVTPDILIVTNFFRDQLDRYGELYTTLNKVRQGIGNSAKTKLILNADDSLCASLGKNVENEVFYFGIQKASVKSVEEIISSDAMFCLFCKSKYEYAYRVYGHLGGFKCTNCGYTQPSTAITCTSVDSLTSEYSKIQFRYGNYSSENIDESNLDINAIYLATINLPGLYNVYNALAALSCGHILNLSTDNSIVALGNFECGFGRMETIQTNGKNIRVILVKNPTGFNQVLNFLLTEENEIQLAFLINDNLADGTDISWLWDVEFEKLQAIQGNIKNIYTSGLRSEDMSVRLKYAGLYTDKIIQIKNYKELINTGLSETAAGNSFYILPTYTAMLDVRSVLSKKYGLKKFWK